ncbi:MAG: carboxypeptidase-like regulatory domain-containing protein [Bacteroidales bacterium]|nr:carboxypeptidase-like regulatory domain-containing protein [Bacteroidales bacterium]
MMLAQTITVTGTVVGVDDGQPIIGAYVLQQGTNNGTSTDLDGNYTINVPKDATLIFSSIGFVTQAVPVNNRSELSIALKTDAVQLEETIVVAYGTAKKGTYTGAASLVKADAIKDVPSVSFEGALNGKVAGLQITQSSGQAGSAAEIRIRGIGSMNAIMIRYGCLFLAHTNCKRFGSILYFLKAQITSTSLSALWHITVRPPYFKHLLIDRQSSSSDSNTSLLQMAFFSS